MSVLTVREYETFRIGESFAAVDEKSVTKDQAEKLGQLSRRLQKRGLRGPLFKSASPTKLQAQQYVGVIQLGTDAIEVRPKIDGLNEQQARSNLFQMLVRTRRLRVFETDLAKLSLQRLNILETFIRLFCDKLFAEVHRGLVGRYERHEDNLCALRGKLQVGLQSTLNACHPERFRCRFDEFTTDTPVNRVLKTAVRRLRRVTRNRENARRLSELQFVFGGVTDAETATLEWHRIHYDRSNRRYEPLVSLAAMILANTTQDVRPGGGEGYGLMYDMNELFEEYIGEVLRATCSKQDVRIQLQGPTRFLLTDISSGKGVFQTRPDITGMRNGGPAWILDTKWKRLNPKERNAGVSQGDVYQMLGYANRYRVDRVILLYPHHGGLQTEPGTQKVFRVLGGRDEKAEQFVHIATVDLRDLHSVPDQLSRILPVAGWE